MGECRGSSGDAEYVSDFENCTRSKGCATPIAPGLNRENGASDSVALHSNPVSNTTRKKRITCKSRRTTQQRAG